MKVKVVLDRGGYEENQIFDADSWEMTPTGGLLIVNSQERGGECVAEFTPSSWSFVRLIKEDDDVRDQ